MGLLILAYLCIFCQLVHTMLCASTFLLLFLLFQPLVLSEEEDTKTITVKKTFDFAGEDVV